MSSAAASPSLSLSLRVRVSRMARASQVVSSFVAVVFAYWLYWLIAVPLIEPNVEQEPVMRASDEDIRLAKEATHSRALSVGKYFPPGSWELEDPAIWESDQTQLLYKSLRPLKDENGAVELKPCTIVFFPKNRDETTQPIIMRAVQGAVVKFDKAIVLQTVDLNKLQMSGGRLMGPITISRNRSRPDADDDLWIATRDVTLVNDRAFTSEPVQFKMGRNRGSGREMEILLAPAEGAPSTQGLRGGTMRTLTLKREVQMELEVGAGPLGSAPAGKKGAPEPPMRVTCQGPFKYDMQQHSAAFQDRVDVLRMNPAGPSDQLTCELLTVFFEARKPPTAHPAPPQPPTTPTTGDQSSFHVRLIEARGEPVILRSPTQGAYVSCQGAIEYSPAPDGSVGRLVALGPGVMQGNLPKDPASKYQLEWRREFRFEPAGSQQVACLLGGAKVRYGQMGNIAADEIFAWLSPKIAPPQTRGPAIKTVSTLSGAGNGTSSAPSDGWQLERVVAQRNDALHAGPRGRDEPAAVMIESAQLDGATDKLEAWVERPLASTAQPTAGNQPPPPTATPRKSTQPQQNPTQRFDVRGGSIRIKLVPDGEQMALSAVTIEKQAQLRELTPRPGERPLLVQGNRLHVANANFEQTRVTVTGEPGYLEAGGMVLRGPAIEMEKHTNRLWIEGPGRMTMPIDQDLDGKPVARPQNLDITWEGGMQFQEKAVVFERTVLARSEQHSLRTEKLEVVLNRTVDFANQNARPTTPGKPEDRPQLAQIRCYGPAFLESRQFDERGQQTAFDRMQASDLALDKVTGAISARGPGWITHVTRDVGQPPGAPPIKPDARPPADKGLKYLNVVFQRSLVGNLNRREATFGEPTKSVYGPVDDWGAKLDAENPASLGPEGMVLDANTLTVRQMPSRTNREQNWYELDAIGNVLGEGSQFTARGDRLTYSQEKDNLVLRGDSLSDAEFFQEDLEGGPRKEFKGKQLNYWFKLQRLLFDGIQSGSSIVPGMAPKKKADGK